MEKYWDIIVQAYKGYANYLWQDVSNPQWTSYFYMLILVSLVFFLLEVLLPWRKGQAILRKDFFLDGFYMFFNFFLFSLLIYNAASMVVVNLFNDGIRSLTGGFDLQAANPLSGFPLWAILLIGFVVRDFVQWWVHRLLHRFDWLWEFHKVHHSVEEMGFAAHLRYHWMETVVYRTLEYIPLALLGIGLYDFFMIHLFTLAWGHYNHANISVGGKVSGGVVGTLIGLAFAFEAFDITALAGMALPLKAVAVLGFTAAGAFLLGPWMPKLFNSPEMHIWHHVHDLPDDHRYGINFGITLAVWDYIFGTAYVPKEGRDIALGFPELEKFPKTFWGQLVTGWHKE